jgi:hypothetical protein
LLQRNEHYFCQQNLKHNAKPTNQFMSLNNINLPELVIADLYRKSLVEIGGSVVKTAPVIAATPQKEITAPAPLQYLGKNLKHITILVHYPDQVYLPEEPLNFLSNILKACQLNIGDIAIVNNATQKTNLAGVAKELGTQKLLLFGDMQQAGINIDHFSIKDIKGIATLAAPELDIINNNSSEGKVLKGKLWNCLKEMFNV